MRESVNSVVKNVLDKVKSATKVEWLTENEFKLIKGWQTNEIEQPATAPGWELREGEFPHLNSLSEHTSGEKNRHSIKTKFAITGKPHRGKGRSALRAAMAKQAAVLMMVAVLATSQAEPATAPTPDSSAAPNQAPTSAAPRRAPNAAAPTPSSSTSATPAIIPIGCADAPVASRALPLATQNPNLRYMASDGRVTVERQPASAAGSVAA